MWVIELNIAGIQIRRHARKRRHLLWPTSGPFGVRMRPSGAA